MSGSDTLEEILRGTAAAAQASLDRNKRQYETDAAALTALITEPKGADECLAGVLAQSPRSRAAR